MKTYKFLIGYHIKTARSFNLLATILTNVWHNKAILKILFVCCNATDKTRAPRGTEPEYNEHFCYKLDSRVKNFTTEWNEKQQHFITHASRSLLWIQFVCWSLPVWRRSFLKKGTYFASPWIRPWADMAKTSLCMCWAMSTSSLPSFVNIH